MVSRASRVRLVGAAGVVWAMAGCATAPPAGDAAMSRRWTGVFERGQGWVGGDGASTLDLGDGRTLWLFGDSAIGSVKADGAFGEGTTLVNNAIGVQRLDDPHAPMPIEFLWGGGEAAWVTPPGPVVSGRGRRWLWPAGGGVALDQPDGSRRLVLFFMMQREAGKEGSVWNFQLHGTAAVVVDHAERPASLWRARVGTLTSFEEALDAGTPARQVTWGAVALPDPESAGAMVLVYGVDVTDVRHKRLLLARAPASSVERFETWEFRTEGGWARRAEEAAALAEGLVDEFSVHRVQSGGHERWLLVQIEPDLGRRILVRWADAPEGPWTDGQPVFACPEPELDKRIIVYSAKAHPELTAGVEDGTVLVSYCVNSLDFWHMAANAWIYRPRVVRIDLGASAR